MSDAQIRKGLKQEYLAHYYDNPETLVVEELGLGYGASRIDIAVVGNNELLGFELKSDQDTLSRLPHQTQFYNAIFDKVTLVVGYSHAYEALTLIPKWWGAIFVEIDKQGRATFSIARDARQNPSPDINMIAKLLWRDEAYQLLIELGIAKNFRYRTRSEICEALAKEADFEWLKSRVVKEVRERTNWRVEKQQVTYAY